MNSPTPNHYDDAVDVAKRDEIQALSWQNKSCANCDRLQFRVAAESMQETALATDSWEIFGL